MRVKCMRTWAVSITMILRMAVDGVDEIRRANTASVCTLDIIVSVK